jgi:hypothetical protein
MPSGTVPLTVDWSGGTAEVRWSTSDNASSNQSTVTAKLWAYKNVGTQETYGTGSWSFRIGDDAVVNVSGVSIPPTGNWVELASRSRTVSHGADGSLSLSVGITSGEVLGTSWNTTNGVKTVALTNYTKTPSAPGTPAVSALTATGLTATWTAPTTTAGGILEYKTRHSTSSTFASGNTETSAGTSLSKTLSGMVGATKYYVGVAGRSADGWGTWSGTNNGVTIPGATAGLALGAITTTGMTATWATGTNGPEITGYDITYSVDADFASATTTTSTTLSKALTGLLPGTKYYVKVRAKNATDTGAYGSTVSQTTLPSVPPDLAVATSVSGTSAVLNFGAPGGVTGVDQYNWERRVAGTITPVTTGSSIYTTNTVTGLTPGTTYEWRANAVIDTYTSPWTSWLSLTQAKPNVSAGDYFDGASTDTDDVNYSWTGTAHASTSTAVGDGVLGWAVGAPVRLQRVLGGRSGAYCARMLVIADSLTGPGKVVGLDSLTGGAAVTAGATYVGSIYVRPSRAQRLFAETLFYDGSNVEVTPRSNGTSVLVQPGVWTRLTASMPVPAGAVTAIVRARDTTGTGYSAWLGGEWLDADDAMITLNLLYDYFDGDTPYDGTYVYEWVDDAAYDGIPHKSSSKRTPVDQVDPATLETLTSLAYLPRSRAILDPNCIPPSPPRPPTIPSDCITEAGIWRRTLATIPAVQVSDYLDVVPTFEIVTLTQNVSQVRIRIYPNPDGLPVDQVDLTSWVGEQIISYVPKDTVLTLDGVHQRVYASVAGGDELAADHLLYGTKGTPATWPVLSCGMDYVISADLPVEIEQAGSRLHTYLTTRY